MAMETRRIIMKTYIQSQFGSCPLVWMFCSRRLNNRINRIHEKFLRIVYNDYNSTFTELSDRDGSYTIDERNMQTLAIEIFKVINGLSSEILHEVFSLKKTLKYNSKHIFENQKCKFCSQWNGQPIVFGSKNRGICHPII